MEDQNTGASSENGSQSAISLQKIYLKDCSFESPHTPAIFGEQWQPEITLNMHTNTSQLSEDVHEVVLHTTLEAKLGEKTAFLIEIEQAGIFQIAGQDEAQVKAALASRCPEMLYPYVRELISSIALNGGYPQLLLQPMNFDELYAKSDAEQAAAAG